MLIKSSSSINKTFEDDQWDETLQLCYKSQYVHDLYHKEQRAAVQRAGRFEKPHRYEGLYFGTSVLISAPSGIKSLTVWKEGNEETQHLIAATAIDVSFHWQSPF